MILVSQQNSSLKGWVILDKNQVGIAQERKKGKENELWKILKTVSVEIEI